MTRQRTTRQTARASVTKNTDRRGITAHRKPRATTGTGAGLPAFEASLAALNEPQAKASIVRAAAFGPLSAIESELIRVEGWVRLLRLLVEQGDRAGLAAGVEIVEPMIRDHLQGARRAFNAAHAALVQGGKAGAQ